MQGDIRTSEEYHTLAGRARGVYVAALWNGRYLNYDSSSSAHHDSIMADMLAGQWYVRACGLPPVVSPDVALSCYRTIYQHNVVDFGEGRLLGAVNGTRPPLEFDTQPGKTVLSLPVSPLPSSDSDDGGLMSELSPSVSAPIALPPAVSKAKVDNSCMQSREVWTGTTYALAAAMIQEAVHYSAVETHPCASVTDGLITTTESDSSPLPAQQTIPDDTSGSTGGAAVVGAGVTAGALTAAERAELLEMAHRTAQGIHDAGWQEFGYWFATPEGWERSGNYRSLGYMRALGIWAMQFAKQQNQSRHA